jgi:hypothetical protein
VDRSKPANDSLERDIAELLPRPVGGPSQKPLVEYKGFLYQAASWKTARRVVAKAEHHAGELFPRVGFIVTNLELPGRPDRISSDEQAGDGKVSEESVERKAGSCFVILRSGKTGAFRPRWKLRTLKTRLAIAFGGGQVYVIGRAAVHNGNPDSTRASLVRPSAPHERRLPRGGVVAA